MNLREPISFLLFFLALLVSGSAEELRTWTSVDGKQMEASLLSATLTEAHFKLESGREAKIPLSRLVQADQDFIADLEKQGLTFAVSEMPGETKTPSQIKVEGGPRLFKTPNFEFQTDQDVSKAFISEAARVYEGTYLAIQSLPLGLDLAPPDGMERFRGIFLNEQAFNQEFGDPNSSRQGQRVAGVYVPSRRELLVPYSSLGAKRSGSQITLRRTSDTTTLIHEITHQVMHEWLPFLPVWMAEGMSEYVASVPYQNGRFEFKNSERGLKERLEEKYRVADFKIKTRIRPSWLIGRDTKSQPATEKENNSLLVKGVALQSDSQLTNETWSGALDEYRDSMLLIYFFIHLDRKEAPAAPVASYFKLIERAKNETDEFIAEYNQSVVEFEQKRKAYNESVKKFNGELETYRIAVNAYNSAISKLNEQISEGVPEKERITVSEPPREPVAPEKLVVPELLKQASKSSPIDMVSIARERATHALLRGRTGGQLDSDFKKAMSEIGIEIHWN